MHPASAPDPPPLKGGACPHLGEDGVGDKSRHAGGAGPSEDPGALKEGAAGLHKVVHHQHMIHPRVAVLGDARMHATHAHTRTPKPRERAGSEHTAHAGTHAHTQPRTDAPTHSHMPQRARNTRT